MVTATRAEYTSAAIVQSQPLACNFEGITPLEYLSLGSRERIHTETLRWLLSNDSPLSSGGSVRLLQALCSGLPQITEVLKVVTEYKQLDLVVKVCRRDSTESHIVIENKLKSAEGPQQLRRYDETAAALGAVSGKFFLTLIGEPAASSPDWRSITYRQFYDSLLAEVTARPPVQSAEFVRDYVDLLSRLVGAVERVVAYPDPYAAIVFGERTGEDAAFAKYVEKTRLKTILQRAWMRELGTRIAGREPRYWDRWSTGETRGNALITFHLAPILRSGRSVDVGVQMQSGQAKIFASPNPYVPEASQDTHDAVRLVLQAFAKKLGDPEAKRTTPRDKGFSSFQAPGRFPKSYGFEEWSTALHELLGNLARARDSVGGIDV
jgi:hypothetical protein